MFLKLTAQVTIIYRISCSTADFMKKNPSVYTHLMKTIYLSLVAKGTFCLKSAVSTNKAK